MQRNADSRERRLQPDHLSLDVARVEELAGIGIPEGGGHLVDERRRLLGRREPERMDTDGPHATHFLVDLIRYLVGSKEAVLLREARGLGTVDRDQIDAHRAGEIHDRALRPATHVEEGIDLAVLEIVGDPLGRDILRREIPLAHAIGREDQPRVDQRSRAWFVERHPPAAQVAHRLDARSLAHDEMHALGEQVGDCPQRIGLRSALVDRRPGIGPVGDVGLHESRLRRPRGYRGHVGDRAAGRHRRCHHTRHAARSAVVAEARAGRIGQGTRDQPADRKIGPDGASRGNAEVRDVLAARGHCRKAQRTAQKGATGNHQLTPTTRLRVGPISP